MFALLMKQTWIRQQKLAARRLASTASTRSLSSTSCSDKVDSTDKQKIPIQAKFKNPIVATLWAMRQECKDRMLLESTSAEDKPIITSKTPNESATEISYPFSTDDFLLESYRSPWGQMRIGKVLEDLDALAGNIAFHHCEGNPLIVTAGVDRIRLKKRPKIGSDQLLSGRVTWVGTSSMEIRMQIAEAEGIDDWMEAYFTFVTLDPNTKKPTAMPSLTVKTEEERAHFELGALKAQARKRARQHKLHLGKPLTEETLELDKQAAALLEEAAPLLSMPSLADPHSILMANTKMQNAMIAQPQVRNLHDRIFGGFLMRRAFELAFSNAYVFGGAKPRFLEVDDITFDSPVNVGDLIVFNSRVIYTQPQGGFLGDYIEDHANHPLVMMEVEAWVTEPEKTKARVSNLFYFTFALPIGTPCRKVLPANIDEARRMATRMTADREQASLRS